MASKARREKGDFTDAFGAEAHVFPDWRDDRDHPYRRTKDIPAAVTLASYERYNLPVMDQQPEHACTGFGLACVANYLLSRRAPKHTHIPVSPRMMYEMAKRHDGDPGTTYAGSNARGALKGWHKHGVCAHHLWPYVANKVDRHFSDIRRLDAGKRPLLRYERVDEADVAAIRSAIAEHGIVYVTSRVHPGWRETGRNGRIPRSVDYTGRHCYALVGYDRDGFWLQNSIGAGWGARGYGHLSERDWEESGEDAWTAHLAPPTAGI